MKKFFYVGVIGLILFEFLNVYFIMPMPGSQRVRSIDLAYFLYTWRWAFRGLFGLLLIIGFLKAFQASKWFTLAGLALVIAAIYAFNFEMAADSMFYQPKDLQMKNAQSNKVEKDRIVIGIELNGEAKAYPISLIAYHHQVLDTLAGKPIMVTYCSVCRTGRIFEPLVNGKPETFRLVGMDHFNAMFEDATTKSWWRQANGEAITGKLKGQTLPELLSEQTSVEKWLALHPNSLIMQPDLNFKTKYDSTAKYEKGKSKSDLTRTDSLSWKDKSWVVGIEIGKESKAFDWLRLKRERVIHEQVGNQPVLVVLAGDDKSFFAYERPNNVAKFSMKNDTLSLDNQRFTLNGNLVNTNEKVGSLKRIKAYQEFWHSWQTFHPATKKY
ncbi:DUF3179 domain-containing (seleno)protein [Emticicia sp. SJ17W-69]|uniref:DUF3179 domain-containing (seleno)protein n=1 Tax=Emticicia sp. SJ17W-69 TaxID=3421657 RepID=UPI003EC0DACD